MKLGLNYKTLENLGYAEFNIALLDLEDEFVGEAEGLVQTDIMREFDLNYDSKKSHKQYSELGNKENNNMALIAAFAKMIEANNDALLLQLKQLGVLET